MHDYFAAWLNRVNVQINDDVTKGRWTATEALADWTGASSAPYLAAVALDAQSVRVEQRAEISQVIQAADSSFPMIGNDAELQVLSASAIVQLFEADPGPPADIGALSVATGTFGERDPETSLGLRDIADAYLLQRALEVRRLHGVPQAAFNPGHVASMTKLFNEAAERLAEVDPDSTIANFETLKQGVTSLTQHLKGVAESDASAHRTLLDNQIALAEENDVLWWVMNRHSRGLGKARAQATTAELTLPSAHELAGLLTVEPPPQATLEYLRQALSSAKGKTPRQLTVARAVEATEPEWRAKVESELPSDTPTFLFPVLAGIRLIATSPADLGQAMAEKTGLASTFSAAPEEIGLHFLRELTLAGRMSESASAEA